MRLTPAIFPLVWIPSALAVYFPSRYFPYERAELVDLAVLAMCLTAGAAFIISQVVCERTSTVADVDGPRFDKSLFIVTLLTSLYISAFVMSGAAVFEGSVFSSKRFLDGANYIKWPINFKILSGLYLGSVFPRRKKLFYFHLLVSALFSFYFAERLHVMEFLVAFALGYLSFSRVRFNLKKALFFTGAFMAIFIIYEATRNFYVLYFVRNNGIDPYEGFLNLLERLAAYYGDTTNKFAAVLGSPEVDFIPFHYIYWLKLQITKAPGWLPGVSIGDFTGLHGLSYENLTNIGSFALFYSDIGAASLLLILILGVLPTVFFAKFRTTGHPIYGVLMVIFAINCLELSRIVYIANLRSWIVFLPVFFILAARASKLRRG